MIYVDTDYNMNSGVMGYVIVYRLPFVSLAWKWIIISMRNVLLLANNFQPLFRSDGGVSGKSTAVINASGSSERFIFLPFLSCVTNKSDKLRIFICNACPLNWIKPEFIGLCPHTPFFAFSNIYGGCFIFSKKTRTIVFQCMQCDALYLTWL